MSDKINDSRKNFEKLGTIYDEADNVTVEKVVIRNVDCYWFSPGEKTSREKIIVYLHGGCFVLGSILSHRALVSHISSQLSLPVLFVDYALAPESSFPKAMNEIMEVYRHLRLQHPASEIILMGDSAGAGLALSVLSKINREDIPAPAYMIMLSPWVDLTCTNRSITANANLDPVLTKEQLLYYVSLYPGNHNLSEASPIETIYGHFPPTLILVGSEEILLDDSRSLYHKIAGKQTKAKLSVYEKQNHVWMLENIHTEESKQALKEIHDFIRSD